MSNTVEFHTWRRIRARCENPKDSSFASYGARGIRVCDEWRSSFETFLRDVGMRPSPQHSIERIDVDGHYEPGNVCWATIEVQNRNKRSNVKLTLDGRTMTAAEWARDLGMSQTGLQDRLRKGWSVERALRTPPSPRGLRRRKVRS